MLENSYTKYPVLNTLFWAFLLGFGFSVGAWFFNALLAVLT
jgi:hypothetical protein